MNNLLYYPSFFIEDEEWLKFALLYLKNVNTIVPEDADVQLSAVHRYLQETHFIDSYRPKYGEIDSATRIVLERLDKRIRNPINNYRGFSKGYNRPNDFEIWRTVENQNFELFRSKFSNELEDFCKENGFAKETRNGVLIPDDIGNEYMSILANEIAKENNMDVITDLKDHKAQNTIISNPQRMFRKQEEVNAVRGYIKLNIPKGLKEIPLEEIIQLRNSQSYKRKLLEFQRSLDNLINQPNYHITESTGYDIQEHLNESRKGLVAELSSLGVALVGTTIGISCTLNNAIPIEIFREIIGSATVFSSCKPIYNRFQENRNRRLATSFVTDIKNLQGKYRYKLHN